MVPRLESAGLPSRIYKTSIGNWWAHQDLNLGPADYESAFQSNVSSTLHLQGSNDLPVE